MKWNIRDLFAAWSSTHWQECILCREISKATVCQCCVNVVDTFEIPQSGSGFINYRPDIQKLLPQLKDHRILAIGPHSSLLMGLINQFKYGKQFILAPILADLLREKVYSCYDNSTLPEAILPVPIHPIKRMIRGFNQTELLCQELVLSVEISPVYNVIKRRKYFNSQAGKTGKQRRNLKENPFDIADKETVGKLSHVAIVDDVITTGTTLRQIVHLLEEVNPDIRIDLWSLSISLPR